MSFVSLFKRSALAWFGLFALAFFNGALREFGLKKGLGMTELSAHQLSCLSGVILMTSFVWQIWRKLNIARLEQAVWVGIAWFFATAVFETFVLNRKMSWSQIFHTYNVTAGELWGLVLLWIGSLPISIFWIRKDQS